MLLTLYAAALVLAVAPADSTRRLAPPTTIAELEARIRHVIDSTGFPGASLTIVRHDSVVYAGGFGLAQLKPPVPATGGTLFRIGSISKAFIAIVALQLQREGKLSLDDPIKKHLPGFWFRNPWEETDPVRIVHLLEHTSGFDDNSLKGFASNDPTPLTLEQGLALDSAERVSRWRPGTRYAYSNIGPSVVALLIQRIAGKPFEQVVQERVFDPLGMRTATYFRPDSTRVLAATLYHADDRTAYPYSHIATRPDGAVNASANDMAQLLRLLLGRGTTNGKMLLTRQDVERMEHPETWLGARAGLTIGYGLNLKRTADTAGFVWVGHDGGVQGGLADLAYLPDHGVGYVLQVNGENLGAAGMLLPLVRDYLTRGLERGREPPKAMVPASIAERFTGWYQPVSPRQQYLYYIQRIFSLTKVTFDSNSMTVRPTMEGPKVFVALDSMHFRLPGETLATVALVTDDGNDRREGMVTFGRYLKQSSMARFSNALARTELTVAYGWLATCVFGALVALFGLVRAFLLMVRRRPRPRPVAAALWRVAIVAGVCGLTAILTYEFNEDITRLGTLTLTSGSIFVNGIAFGLFALLGLFVGLKRRAARGWWQRTSLWTARVVLALHFVVASYLMYWGFIGWRTWA